MASLTQVASADAIASLTVAEEGDDRWDALLVCVAGYILTAVGRVHQLFGALEVIHLTALTGFLGILLFAIDRYELRRGRYLLVPTTKVLAALLFWMILSVPGALNPGNSFDLVFDNFLKTTIMFLVVAGSVRSVRDVERLVVVYFASAVMYTGVVMTRFNLGDGADWRLGHLYYYDANDFATFVVTAMPFGLYLLHAGRRLTTRWLAAIGLVVLALGFVWSGSRGGFIALSAVAGFIVLRYTAIPLRWRLSATALVAIVLLTTASDQYWQQMATITSDTDYNQTSESGRLQIWSRGIGYMLQNPVFGLGPLNFQVAEGTLSPLAERQQYGIGVRWNAPHNSFVQIGAELGVVGLAIYAAFIISAFVALRRSGGGEPESGAPQDAQALTPALTASLMGFVIGSFFLSLAYSEMLYTLVALAVGLQKVTRDEPAG